jgi:hypothetical protein
MYCLYNDAARNTDIYLRMVERLKYFEFKVVKRSDRGIYTNKSLETKENHETSKSGSWLRFDPSRFRIKNKRITARANTRYNDSVGMNRYKRLILWTRQ